MKREEKQPEKQPPAKPWKAEQTNDWIAGHVARYWQRKLSVLDELVRKS